MPATYAASAELARPQSAFARGLDREHGSLHIAEYERAETMLAFGGPMRRLSSYVRAVPLDRTPSSRQKRMFGPRAAAMHKLTGLATARCTVSRSAGRLTMRRSLDELASTRCYGQLPARSPRPLPPYRIESLGHTSHARMSAQGPAATLMLDSCG
jgi:hypothetical protein